ncbi:MAG TPA: condensation domain-containing protein, partial [Steroidobacteraceae bacterium]
MFNVIDSYALSPMQQGMLFHAVSEKQTGVDIEQIVMTLQGHCDVEQFMRAWQAVIQRHTILRTQFRWEDVPEPRQEVVADVELPLIRADWGELAAAEREEHCIAHLAADRRRDLDLSRAPLMRLFIADMGANQYRIVWTFHHALLDGRSFPNVLREVFSLYESALGGAATQLPPASPYREHIDWLQSLDHAESEAHWRTTLRGFHAPTPFGVDASRIEAANATVTGAPFGAKQRRLSADVTSQLREFAQSAGVTVNTLLQAAWGLLLQRYSGQSDIIFGATRAGRKAGGGDNESRVGLFINTLPVRVRVDGDLEMIPWLQQLRAQQTGLRAFEHTPLSVVQSWSEVPRGTPLFESLVVYEHSTLNSQLRSAGGTWLDRHFEYLGQTNFPLTLVAYGDDEMLLRLEYSRQRFADAAIERMMGHLTVLLAGLAKGEATRLKDLELLTPAEREQLMGSSSAARQYAPGPTLHERFEQQVARSPQAIALSGFTADEARFEMSY